MAASISRARCSARSSKFALFSRQISTAASSICAYIDGNLEYANPADATKRDTLGYVKDGRILVEPTAWRGVLCAGYDPVKTARHLRTEGLLMADEAGGKLQRQEKVKARRRRRDGPLLRARPKNTRRRGRHRPKESSP